MLTPIMEQFIVPVMAIWPSSSPLAAMPLKLHKTDVPPSSMVTEKLTLVPEYCAEPPRPFTFAVPVPASLSCSVTGRLSADSTSASTCRRAVAMRGRSPR